MLYDVLISASTVMGIVTVLVYSYKILHGPLYPIGIVRELPEPQKLVEVLPEEGATSTEPVQWEAADWKEAWYCENCGLVQPRGKDLQCRRCKRRRIAVLQLKKAVENVEESAERESEHLARENEIAEHGETLKFHSSRFRDIEKRLRKLEVESLRQSQEAAEEIPQLPRPEVVH